MLASSWGLGPHSEGTPPGIGRGDFCTVSIGPRKIISPALEVVGDSFNPRNGSLDAPTHLLEKVPGGGDQKQKQCDLLSACVDKPEFH